MKIRSGTDGADCNRIAHTTPVHGIRDLGRRAPKRYIHSVNDGTFRNDGGRRSKEELKSTDDENSRRNCELMFWGSGSTLRRHCPSRCCGLGRCKHTQTNCCYDLKGSVTVSRFARVGNVGGTVFQLRAHVSRSSSVAVGMPSPLTGTDSTHTALAVPFFAAQYRGVHAVPPMVTLCRAVVGESNLALVSISQRRDL